MRPVTGSNPAQSSNYVSIQLTLGGHSFSIATLPADVCNSSEPLLCVIDTPRVTLIPAEIFDSSIADSYLALNGITCRKDEKCVYSEACNGMVAVIAIASKALNELRSKFGERVHFTTPLLDSTHQEEKKALIISCSEHNTYLRLYNDGLRIAEAIETSSPNEILYYIARLSETTELGDTPIYIIGSKATKKTVKKYYKNVI